MSIHEPSLRTKFKNQVQELIYHSLPDLSDLKHDNSYIYWYFQHTFFQTMHPNKHYRPIQKTNNLKLLIRIKFILYNQNSNPKNPQKQKLSSSMAGINIDLNMRDTPFTICILLMVFIGLARLVYLNADNFAEFVTWVLVACLVFVTVLLVLAYQPFKRYLWAKHNLLSKQTIVQKSKKDHIDYHQHLKKHTEQQVAKLMRNESYRQYLKKKFNTEGPVTMVSDSALRDIQQGAKLLEQIEDDIFQGNSVDTVSKDTTDVHRLLKEMDMNLGKKDDAEIRMEKRQVQKNRESKVPNSTESDVPSNDQRQVAGFRESRADFKRESHVSADRQSQKFFMSRQNERVSQNSDRQSMRQSQVILKRQLEAFKLRKTQREIAIAQILKQNVAERDTEPQGEKEA